MNKIKSGWEEVRDREEWGGIIFGIFKQHKNT